MNKPTTEQTGTAIAPRQAREIVRVEHALPIFDTAEFEHMQRIAGLVGFAACMPEALRGGNDRETLANAVMIINKARRMNIDPFDLAAHTYVGPGKRLGYEGKIIHAYAEERLKHGFDFEYSGEGMNRQITVTNVRPVDRKAKSVSGTVQMWHTKEKSGAVKGNWKNDPDKQLRYRGVVEWCRAWAPGFVTGVMTEDELSAFDEDFEERQRGRHYVEVPSARAPQTLEAEAAVSDTVRHSGPGGEEEAAEVETAEDPFDWEKNQADFVQQLPIATTEKMLDDMIALYDVDGMPDVFQRQLQEAADKRREELIADGAAAQGEAVAAEAIEEEAKTDAAEPQGWSDADVEQEEKNLRNARTITALDAAFDNRVDPQRGELTDAQYERLVGVYNDCKAALDAGKRDVPETTGGAPTGEQRDDGTYTPEFGAKPAPAAFKVYDKAKEIIAAPDMDALRALFTEVDAAVQAGLIEKADYDDLAAKANERAKVLQGKDRPKRGKGK